MPIDTVKLLEWAALGGSVIWVIGLWSMLMGSRRARRAFRGKGYLRPPSGRAWLRFLYFQHYDSFEDPSIRFYYRIAHYCLIAFVILVVMLLIFIGSVLVLTRVSSSPSLTS